MIPRPTTTRAVRIPRHLPDTRKGVFETTTRRPELPESDAEYERLRLAAMHAGPRTPEARRFAAARIRAEAIRMADTADVDCFE